MIVVSNRLQVAKGHEADFEKRFKGRARLVENIPGFVRLEILRPINALTLSSFVALCSGILGKALEQQLVVLGSMSLGGNIIPVGNLASCLQVAFDAGAKRILLPMASVGDIPTIPGELFAKFQTSFYSDPTDAVFKALGVH